MDTSCNRNKFRYFLAGTWSSLFSVLWQSVHSELVSVHCKLWFFSVLPVTDIYNFTKKVTPFVKVIKVSFLSPIPCSVSSLNDLTQPCFQFHLWRKLEGPRDPRPKQQKRAESDTLTQKVSIISIIGFWILFSGETVAFNQKKHEYY